MTAHLCDRVCPQVHEQSDTGHHEPSSPGSHPTPLRAPNAVLPRTQRHRAVLPCIQAPAAMLPRVQPPSITLRGTGQRHRVQPPGGGGQTLGHRAVRMCLI
jgi:hypothetical protein